MEPEKLDFDNMTPRQLRRYLQDKLVIVASNRGPVEFYRAPSGEIRARRGAGGLVTAMSTALLATEAVWISPVRTPEDAEMAERSADGKVGIPLEDPQYWVKFIRPDPERYRLYYDVISNTLLWFMQHYMFNVPDSPVIDRETNRAWDEGYRSINRLFAEEIVREIESTSRQPLVFLQDYHLYLCARHIRERVPHALIHHFTHSPWVQPDYFHLLPTRMRREIMQGLLSCDVIGFHTPRYAANFLQCCHEGDAVRVSLNMKKRSVSFGGREILVRHYPISIDHEALQKTAARPEVEEKRRRLRERAGEGMLLVRVDRIEPSKNILRGLQAYRLFLRHFPHWRGRVTFAVLLYPSRESIPAYRRYRESIEEEARGINEEFAEGSWEPVYLEIEDDYLRSVAALSEYDALMVNPIFDGMNLVAKEGAVLNRRDGVILLSVNAGAYAELRGAVLPVNPLDIWDTAQLLDHALSMPAERRKAMALRARETVMQNTSFKWLLRQIQNLRRAERIKLEEQPLHLETTLKFPSWIRQI